MLCGEEDIELSAMELRLADVLFRNDIVIGAGGKQCFVDDPSGNPTELFQPTIPDARFNDGSWSTRPPVMAFEDYYPIRFSPLEAGPKTGCKTI